MFVGVEAEKMKHEEVFMAVVDVVLSHGIVSGYVEWLCRLVLEKDSGAFRRALCGDHCSGAASDSPSEARGGSHSSAAKYLPSKGDRVVCGAFVVAGHRGNGDQQPQSDSFERGNVGAEVQRALDGDYRVVYELVEQAATPMSQYEELGMLLGWAAVFCTVGMIEGDWEISLHEFVQYFFIMVTTSDLYIRRHRCLKGSSMALHNSRHWSWRF